MVDIIHVKIPAMFSRAIRVIKILDFGRLFYKDPLLA